MLRLSSLAAFALAALALAACGPTTIANSDGGGGSTTTTTTTDTGCTNGHCVNSCVAAGGSCDPITPEFCQGGTIGDATQYSCGTGVGVGCCLPAQTCATEPCTTEGATRCSGSVMQVCGFNPATNCALEWLTQAACPDGQSCNSDSTKCVAPVTSCTAPADCGCGCTCTSAGVCGECTGAIPPTCTVDADCGPACYGYQCVSGKCQQHTP
jgi:hypothetical protein